MGELSYAQYVALAEADIRNKHYKKTYGITLEEYDQLLEAQGGGCAICGAKESTRGRRLGVDHNHETKKVRGLLCNHCNSLIGFAKDDTYILQQAIDYLRKDK